MSAKSDRMVGSMLRRARSIVAVNVNRNAHGWKCRYRCPVAIVAPMRRADFQFDLSAVDRENRVVDIFLSITYGPAVHTIKVTLTPHFS